MIVKFRKSLFAAVITLTLFLPLFLAGCASKQVQEEQYSGYLGKDIYASMSEIKYPSGAVGMAVVDPYVYGDDFFEEFLSPTKVMVDPVIWHPTPKPGPQIRSEVLMQLAKYYNEKVVEEIKKAGTTVVDKPGPGVIRMSPAFTGVKTSAEGMKAYEVVPVAAVFGAAKAASGSRNRVVEVFFEVKITDSQTGELFAAAIRKGIGTKKLKGKKEQMTLGHSRPVLDQFVSDFIDALKHLKQRIKIGS